MLNGAAVRSLSTADVPAPGPLDLPPQHQQQVKRYVNLPSRSIAEECRERPLRAASGSALLDAFDGTTGNKKSGTIAVLNFKPSDVLERLRLHRPPHLEQEWRTDNRTLCRLDASHVKN